MNDMNYKVVMKDMNKNMNNMNNTNDMNNMKI